MYTVFPLIQATLNYKLPSNIEAAPKLTKLQWKLLSNKSQPSREAHQYWACIRDKHIHIADLDVLRMHFVSEY